MATTHPSESAGMSQCDAILLGLTARAGEWVPMPLLARLAGAYAVHSRVADLRRRGYQIDQRNLRHCRKVLSQYRLSDPAPHRPFSQFPTTNNKQPHTHI